MHLTMERSVARKAVLLAMVLLGALIVAVWGGVSAAAQLPGQLRVSAGGPYSGAVGQSITFIAQVSTGGLPPGTPVQVQWNFGDGSTGFGQSTTHAYARAGTYQVTVLATAGGGQSATSSTTAQISSGVQPGTLSVSAGGPYRGQAGTPIFFTATIGLGGRPPGTPVQVLWNFGDGNTGSGASTTHTYAAPGTYTVTVVASVGVGQTATSTTTAQITGSASLLTVSPGGPYTGRVGQPVSFSGSVMGALIGATVQYSWSFGDGSTGTGQSTTHTYSAAGSYTVTLTVSTSANQQASASTTATITAGTETVSLTTGCSNVSLTWPNGTPVSTVGAAVSPTGILTSVWRYDTAQGRFLGYNPSAPSFVNDLQTVNRLEAVFICVSSPGTLNRPPA